MAFGTITVTESTFGSISGTVIGAVPGTLSGSVGVPGPQGPAGAAGATGAQGPAGAAGVGVPAGGTTGQALVKTSNTNYATGWTTLNLTQYLEKANNLSDLTSASTARYNLGLGHSNTVAFRTVNLAGTSGSVSTTASMSGVGNAPVFSFNNEAVFEGETNTRQAFTVNGNGISHLNYTTYDFGVPDDGFTFNYNASNGKIDLTQLNDAGSGGTGSTAYILPGEVKVTSPNTEGAPTADYSIVSASSNLIGVYRGSFFASIEPGMVAIVGSGGTMSILSNEIQFPDESRQFTAFPGFNNAALTGNSTAVTPATSDNDTSIATTAFVKAQGYAPLASPALTGNPTAPTAALADNDTSIATTAFVQQELLSGTANARNLEVYVRNQTGSTIPAGSIVYINGATGNRPTITLAQANNDANSAQTIGFTKTAIANNGFGFVIVRGECENLNTSALTEGVQLYLSPTTAGTWTTTKPSAPQHLVYVGIVIRSHPTLGTILVSVQNGYELNELHDVALSSEANNDLLVYELSTDLWKNKSFSTLGLATLASPAFTGTPSLPTGTTAVTQTAGDNTTALATTAFVTASNPDASTTVKGHVELATNAEAQLGSSDTLAMSPSAVQYARLATTFFRLSALNAVGATSGTGSAASLLASGFNSRSPTTAVGYGILSFGIFYHSRGSGSNSVTPLPWNKRFVAQFRFHPRTLGTDANTINRVLFGKTGVPVTGELTQRGVGVRQIANGPLELVVHNGTTFTAVTSSYTPANLSSTDLRIVSDGAGNVTLFNNDSQIATTSAGPSTAGATNNTYLTVESENLATITGTNNTLYTAEMSFEFAL